MPAPKGNNHNPAGRPKGTPNKVAREVKEKLTMFLEAKFPDMVKAYNSLTDEEKVRYYEKLMPYVIPKNAAVAFEVNDPESKGIPPWMITTKAIEVKPDDPIQDAEITE